MTAQGSGEDRAPFLIFCFVVVSVIVHVSFAIAILNDAKLRSEDKTLVFVGPWIWFLTVLFGGMIGATVYWLIHCSILNPNNAQRISEYRNDVGNEHRLEGVDQTSSQTPDSDGGEILDETT